jgi:hypothetical protein
MMRRWYAQPVPWGIFVFTILLLGVVFGAGVAFAIRSASDSQDAKTAAALAKIVATRQQEGRAVAIDFLCGYSNGVADAGRRALAGTLKGERGPGLPQKSQDDYVAILNQRLIDQVGVKAADVLIRSGPNGGLIDCAKLSVAAKATHP